MIKNKFRFELQKRFWSKVNIDLNINNCWEWIPYKDKDGYGTFYFDGISMKAHRYVYLLYYDVDSYKYEICHTCDNPSCVNPLHLFNGSHLDNMADMVNKNRSRISIGSNNVNTKLTENEIITALNLIITNNIRNKEELIKYNNKFTIRCINNILFKYTWTHVTNIFDDYQWNYIKDRLSNYLTEYDVRCIEYEIQTTNKTNVELSQKYDVSIHTLSRIRNKKHKYSK